MIKTSVSLAIGLGSIAASYFYGQVFIGLVAAIIVAINNLLYAVGTAAMSVMALSAVPYIVIGLAVALVGYSMMLQVYKWYYRDSSEVVDQGGVQVVLQQEFSHYKIAVAAIILGLVAAIVCKVFFAAAVLGAISFVSGVIATIASFAFVSAISTAITAALTSAIFPTVLAYIIVGAASAYAAKSLLDWVAGLFGAKTPDNGFVDQNFTSAPSDKVGHDPGLSQLVPEGKATLIGDKHQPSAIQCADTDLPVVPGIISR